jgi:ubiquinone/menaquinone biosynthesis C-methylase UbiE
MESSFAARQNGYIIDIEEGAETARLFAQDQLFTRAMGGLFAAPVPVERVYDVLDLACGPGGWVIEVARQYPDMDITGVDINPTMCRYAAAMARVRDLSDNVMFEEMDITQPLDFPAHSFDLINGRFLVGFMQQATWPALLSECWRVLRPEGMICLTECEYSVSSSLALQRLNMCLYEALRKEKRTFSVDGHSFGIVHRLGTLLREAGFAEAKTVPFVLDASSGSALHLSTSKNTEVAFALLKPFLLRVGSVGAEEFEQLYQQTLIDLRAPDFTCISFGCTIWAMRP